MQRVSPGTVLVGVFAICLALLAMYGVKRFMTPGEKDMTLADRGGPTLLRHAETIALSSAVQRFAKRLDVPDVHSVASMVWQAEQQGASVAGAFQAFSDQVRLTRRQRAEEAANKTAFKMLFPLVLCLMPAVNLVLLGPAVLDLRNFFRTAKEPGGPLAMPDISTMAAPPSVPGPTAPAPPSGARALPPMSP